MSPHDFGPVTWIDLVRVLFFLLLPGLVAMAAGLTAGFFLPTFKAVWGLGIGFLVGIAAVYALFWVYVGVTDDNYIYSLLIILPFSVLVPTGICFWINWSLSKAPRS